MIQSSLKCNGVLKSVTGFLPLISRYLAKPWPEEKWKNIFRFIIRTPWLIEHRGVGVQRWHCDFLRDEQGGVPLPEQLRPVKFLFYNIHLLNSPSANDCLPFPDSLFPLPSPCDSKFPTPYSQVHLWRTCPFSTPLFQCYNML